MDERTKEMLLRKAREDNRVFEGYSPLGVELKGSQAAAGMRKLSQAAAQGQGFKMSKAPTGKGSFNVNPSTVKRTDRARVESLANRLWKAVQSHNPAETELILQMLQAEGWKAGSPVSYEEVKNIAVQQMKLAAAKMKPQ